MTNSGTISSTITSATDAQTGSFRASEKPTAIMTMSDSELMMLSPV